MTCTQIKDTINAMAVQRTTPKLETPLGAINEKLGFPHKLEESLKLPFRDGIDVPERQGRNEVLERRLMIYLNNDQFANAIRLLQADLDIAIVFDKRSTVSSNALFHLLGFMSRTASDFFSIAMQRMALIAGLAWTTRFEFAWTSRFKSYFRPGQAPGTNVSPSGRSKIDYAASLFEKTVQVASETSCERPTVFQLACAAQNYEVVTYLLRVGLGPNSAPAYAHPIIQARGRKDDELEQRLRNRLHIPRDIYTRALWSLFSPRVVHRVYWYSGTQDHQQHAPCLLPALQAAKIFLGGGANTSSEVDYRGQSMPLIHATIYALHDADISNDYKLELFSVLVTGGTNVDAVGEEQEKGERISPLALAATLGELDLLNILLDNGAKLFWPRFSDIFLTISDGTDSSGFEAIVTSLARHDLLWPDNRANDGHTTDESHSSVSSNAAGPGLAPQPSLTLDATNPTSLSLPSSETRRPPGPIKREIRRDSFAPSPSTSSLESNITDLVYPPFTRASPELESEFNLLPHDARNDQLSKEMIIFIQRGNHDHAVQSLLEGADLAFAFVPEFGGPLPDILDFLWHLWRMNMFMFFLAVQRLAFVTGGSWILELRNAFLRESPRLPRHAPKEDRPISKRKPKESRLDCVWRLIVRSAILTSNRRRTDKSDTTRPALHYACAAKNEAVVKYLLHIGQRITIVQDAASALSRSTAITRMLTMEYAFNSGTLSFAIERIFKKEIPLYGSSDAKDSLVLSEPESTECMSMIETLLWQGANTSVSMLRGTRSLPLLHAAIYTDGPLRLGLTKLVLDHGANMDAIGFVPWHEPTSSTRVSVLAMAALIPLPDVLDLLISRGAAWIWSSDLDLQRLAEKNFTFFYIEAVINNRKTPMPVERSAMSIPSHKLAGHDPIQILSDDSNASKLPARILNCTPTCSTHLRKVASSETTSIALSEIDGVFG